MYGVRRILAVVDTRKDQHLALNRAIQIAGATDSSLHILAANPKPTAESMERLLKLGRKAEAEGIETSSHETWRNNVVETIIHVRQTERCHLVIKDHQPESFLEKTLKTPVDWTLMRKSRVPVLLVKHDRPYKDQNMLATINADPDDAEHQLLNMAIMKNAQAACQPFAGKLSITTAYPTVMLATQNHLDGKTDREHYQENCSFFAKDYGVDPDNIHVRPAPAETMIPALAKELGVELMIMGTHARTGISAVTLGNTAEQLTRHIECDLLAVQAKHHMMPLERELEL